MREEGFLHAILENPRDDANHLVYADWLEEQGDERSQRKAEFLRQTVEAPPKNERNAWRKNRGERLQALATSLDPAWLAVVSRPGIENCLKKQRRGGPRVGPLHFDLLCDRRWGDLQPTEEETVRFCNSCEKTVHFCDTIGQARHHAEAGHCIAVDLGVIRREGDLGSPQTWVGQPSREMAEREERVRSPDPVSAERMRRKDAAALATLARLGAGSGTSVSLSAGCSQDDLDRMQQAAQDRSGLRFLGEKIPNSYVELLRLSDGVRIMRAVFKTAHDVVAENLSIMSSRHIILGEMGGRVRFVYSYDDGRYYAVNMGGSSDSFRSYDTLGGLLIAVLREQGVA